jgi:hypothetical protein
MQQAWKGVAALFHPQRQDIALAPIFARAFSMPEPVYWALQILMWLGFKTILDKRPGYE